VKRIVVGLAVSAVTISLLGAAAVPSGVADASDIGSAAPLVIDLGSAVVHEVGGEPVQAIQERDDSGEQVELAILSTGEPALITIHSALPVESTVDEPISRDIDPEALAAGRAYEGILPQEMVPTYTRDIQL